MDRISRWTAEPVSRRDRGRHDQRRGDGPIHHPAHADLQHAQARGIDGGTAADALLARGGADRLWRDAVPERPADAAAA